MFFNSRTQVIISILNAIANYTEQTRKYSEVFAVTFFNLLLGDKTNNHKFYYDKKQLIEFINIIASGEDLFCNKFSNDNDLVVADLFAPA